MSAPETAKQENLYELLKGFSTGMLVSRQANDQMQARPMSVAELRSDADIYFATSLESPKITELAANPECTVTFQSSSTYAVINGRAEVVKDRALIDRLWSEAWRVWFPGGKDDPTLCLLKVDAKDAEYWDNSGLQGVKYLFEGVKAVLQGNTPSADDNQHAKVAL